MPVPCFCRLLFLPPAVFAVCVDGPKACPEPTLEGRVRRCAASSTGCRPDDSDAAMLVDLVHKISHSPTTHHAGKRGWTHATTKTIDLSRHYNKIDGRTRTRLHKPSTTTAAATARGCNASNAVTEALLQRYSRIYQGFCLHEHPVTPLRPLPYTITLLFLFF